MTARRPIGLAGRLWFAQAVVVVVGAATIALVASLVGPRIFHAHLDHVVGVPPAASRHVEQAYASANAAALGLALVVALVAAAAVSMAAARRLTRPVTALAAAAAKVADGDYAARVPPPGLGAEFDRLATAFHQMAVRLAAVDTTRHRMLADLAHELRTPVATIEAYLDAAADGIEVPGEDLTQVLRSQTERLRHLAEDLAAISQAEERALERRPVSPAALVTGAVDAARAAYAGKGVALHARCDPDLPDLDLDPDRIDQVLANLLNNALRHTEPGGTVAVTAGAGADALVLAVHDTGDGIAQDSLPHLFERFYRGDAARGRGGSGIGLAIVRAVVTAHGGRVEAASPGPGGGATFTVTMPYG